MFLGVAMMRYFSAFRQFGEIRNNTFICWSAMKGGGGGEGVDNFAEKVRDRWSISICRRPLS